MKAKYRVREELEIEVEGENQEKLFAAIADAAVVFGETCCGLCGGTAIVPLHRNVQGNDFYEWECRNPDCLARLTVSQHKELKGSLFIHRKLEATGKPSWKTGERGAHNGWTKYRGEPVQDDDREPAARPAPAPQRPAAVQAPARPQPAPPQGSPRPASPTNDGTEAKWAQRRAEQWEQIKVELAKRYISPRALLEYFKVGVPRELTDEQMVAALKVAQQPDDALRALQKGMRQGTM